MQMLLIITVSLLSAVIGASIRAVVSQGGLDDHDDPAIAVCRQIDGAISSASNVYWPAMAEYEQDIEHYALSSTQMAACSVEPGTSEDVGTILTIVGSTRTPFAVKSGGHAINPGFSSTTGVQVSMNRFRSVTYDMASRSVRVGTGQIWDDVYAALEPFGVNVVGGRVSGIGIGGLTLGGGYSWLTNQYGLALDNVLAYELVLPNGTVAEVTASSYPDLFFSLRGGFNNFGIVTTFKLKTYPQTQVWGGQLVYDSNKLEEFRIATSNFTTNNRDPKAAIIAAFGASGGVPSASLLIFYDAPIVPEGIFDGLLSIEYVQADVSTRSFLSLVRSSASNSTQGLRAGYNTVSLTNYSEGLLDVIINETLSLGTNRRSMSSIETPELLSYAIESFTPDLFTHGSDSAYPPDRSRELYPLNIYYAWNSTASDDYFMEAIKKTAVTITAAADLEGQDIGDAALYGNYALEGTPVSRIYGSNLPRLQDIKERYDPENIMSLAGGWKI